MNYFVRCLILPHSRYIYFSFWIYSQNLFKLKSLGTSDVDSDLGSGLSDIWILKSEEKREVWRIAAISPLTSTATSFCTTQQKIYIYKDYVFSFWNNDSGNRMHIL